MNAEGVRLRDEDAVGANSSDLGVGGAHRYCEYANKDGDGGGSDCPTDFVSLSEDRIDPLGRVQSAGRV